MISFFYISLNIIVSKIRLRDLFFEVALYVVDVLIQIENVLLDLFGVHQFVIRFAVIVALLQKPGKLR